MAIRRELVLILVLLLVIAVLVKLIEFFQADVVEADASKFVLEDLDSKYPGAGTSIMSITPKTNPSGAKYFEVKARVTENPLSPCPERSHIFYNYPAQNFVPQPAEVITSGCSVCTEGICTIAFPEEAVIASHTFPGTSAVHAYVYGSEDARPFVTENPAGESWRVVWDSPGEERFMTAEVHRNGTILSVTDNARQ